MMSKPSLFDISKGLRLAALLLFIVYIFAAGTVRAMDSAEYVLGTSDKVKIIVFGEAELSGDFEVNSTGQISMPLIGSIQGSGQTVAQLQTALTQKLSSGYLRDPRVSVEVQSYRPFFILGEVTKPGSYPYVNGMSVVSAVALAGGYTYRADKDDIKMKRGGEDAKEEIVKEETPVLPGDVITVPERFF